MSLITEASASNSLDSLLRYRFVVLSVTGLFGLSALAMTLLAKPSRDISGVPAYLFSIPASSERVQREGALVGPLGVSAWAGKVAVTDSGEGKVKIYDYEGAFQSHIDLAPLAAGKQKRAYPTAVAHAPDGSLYVADIVSRGIYVFGPDLSFRSRIPKLRSQLERPLALAVADDELYVTDAGDSSIKVFSPEGVLLRTLVSPRTRRASLSYANGIGLGAEGRIYVADSNNRKVFAFSSEGRQLLELEATLGLPRGIAVDTLDRVHVVDTFGHKVVVFGTGGKRLFEYGAQGNEQGITMGFPNGISIDSRAGRAFITDRADNRVQVWGWPDDS